LSIRQPL